MADMGRGGLKGRGRGGGGGSLITSSFFLSRGAKIQLFLCQSLTDLSVHPKNGWSIFTFELNGSGIFYLCGGPGQNCPRYYYQKGLPMYSALVFIVLVPSSCSSIYLGIWSNFLSCYCIIMSVNVRMLLITTA